MLWFGEDGLPEQVKSLLSLFVIMACQQTAFSLMPHRMIKKFFWGGECIL